jgi:hypothetical protein
MFHILKRRSTHASKLERWLGADGVNELSVLNKGWYGPPIALAGVPGCVHVGGDGDFVGNIDGGGFQNSFDYAAEKTSRLLKAMWRANRHSMNAGFADLADLQFEATKGGKSRYFPHLQANQGSSGRWTEDWQSNAQMPPQGVAMAAAPGGTTCSQTTTGSLRFVNPASGDFQFFVQGEVYATGPNNVQTTRLLVDRLFGVVKTINSTASQAVDGVPSRYQSTTSSDWDWAGGNFIYPVATATTPATAFNWTVCQYTNQNGTTSQSIPSTAGAVSIAANNLAFNGEFWYMPLAAGDTGVKALTQMQMSALVATGGYNMVIAHPIAWFCCPVMASINVVNGINSAWQMTRIFDDACLTFLTRNNNNGTGHGYFQTVAG